MASLVTDQGIIHYETYGRGRPVLLLHGWLGSWSLWRNTIEELGKEFRTYALDFWGFGESDTAQGESGFTVDNFVEMVAQFMDKLGIAKAPLIGHSMGGTVSLGMAIRHPEKVVKVTVIGSPIQGSSLNIFLKLAGNKQIARLLWIAPSFRRIFIGTMAYYAARKGKEVSTMVLKDVMQVSLYSFFQSIGTLRQTDLSPRLSEVKVPTLGIYGSRDIIVSPRQKDVLKAGVKQAQIAYYTDTGHFPMIDFPDRFHQEIRNFLLTKTPTPTP